MQQWWTENSWAFLGALFAMERERFARVFPHVSKAQWSILRHAGPCTLPNLCRPRDMAYAEVTWNPPVVMFHEKILSRPIENKLGLIRHELGHIADVNVREPGREQRADDIAEMVTGERISYDAGDVQTIAPGKYPRPLRLHR